MFLLVICKSTAIMAQQSPFEQSGGKATATYTEAIAWYQQLDKTSPMIALKEMGMTDAGYPLHLVLISSDGSTDPVRWRRQNKVIILINNGIHPGEPDGIDASMLLARDIATRKIVLPPNIALGIIPVYNVGGCLNRNRTSRANQDGPVEYGFRGNAQNLDLNRDFTKCDSREALSFAAIFHWLDPDILVDNHVSDGADYTYTMTMLTTQYNKLGDTLGTWLRNQFEPQLYAGMKAAGEEMCPYVNFETTDFGRGMEQFYDPPRYSSGYAALFQTIGFVPETHMLKPFADRVRATYSFMQVLLSKAATNADALHQKRREQRNIVTRAISFPLGWQPDSTAFSMISFKGYERDSATSAATGLSRMYYNHARPFTKDIRYYHHFRPVNTIAAPKAYLIPQGWHTVINLLRANGVNIQILRSDTTILVEACYIEDYKSYPKPYEKHHKNYDIKVNLRQQRIRLLRGDVVVPMNQPANRYIAEMLEPTGDDSFFAWNFFDAILQQKEGYSDYRWEDVAAEVLRNNPALQQQLAEKKKADPKFAASSSAQLAFIYKNSPYYEPGHMRYPVYRLPKN